MLAAAAAAVVCLFVPFSLPDRLLVTLLINVNGSHNQQ